MYRCCWLLIKIIIIICDLLPFINICTVHEYIKKNMLQIWFARSRVKRGEDWRTSMAENSKLWPQQSFFQKKFIGFSTHFSTITVLRTRSGWDSNSGSCWCLVLQGLLSSWEANLIGRPTRKKVGHNAATDPHQLMVVDFPPPAIPQF